MIIRNAEPGDAAAIAAIYNHAVEHTTAIWNEATVTSDNRANWITGRQQGGFPVLVAVDEAGDIAGYASYGPWRAFDGYRHTVEHSVYVEKDHRGQGIGRQLMDALLKEAGASGIHVMIAGIEAENAGSIALHRKLGFVEAGTLHEVGTKFGRWLDLTFMEFRFG
ncbi:phosphinothricin acetyltransferase [Cohaesibacter sp. ES.047]|uniref:GNAT family N-acetyltransferase n=1 Tax=Cohaesibacter sp. ES.047 TaxID=1798205 RepID=UPI000BB82D83|nr:GNAT family N-acetyltransferase [Cohaesibacter sp. ES.047]SNY92622.1 phosphinothricin acetyltransferase [Cohaesibacter sp. ES.047]